MLEHNKTQGLLKSMKGYNLTQLDPKQAFERHVYHRDMFAHYLRFSHVLRLAKIGMSILDVGCGSGGLYEVFYRNRYAPRRYLGLDIRRQTIEKNKVRFPRADWECVDIATPDPDDFDFGRDWDIITSFEVFEHVHKKNGDNLMENIKRHCNENTIVLVSTPVYNEEVGAAANHTYDGMVHERTFNEMRELCERHLEVEMVYGTFASQRDYKKTMLVEDLIVFNKLRNYYDSNLVSVIFAPLYPQLSRNCLWKLRLRK